MVRLREPNRKLLLDWVARDGPDTSVRFVISEKGVSRLSGKTWRTTREAGRALGWVVLLAGLVSRQSGWTGWGPTKHWLGSKPQDRQFMSWKKMRKVDVDEKKQTISLYDDEGIELCLCCTPETFESALQYARERVAT